MKKFLTFAGIALIAAACTNNDESSQEYGQINLTLESSTVPEIEVNTRTVTNLTETEANNYNIQVLRNGSIKLESTKYSNFKNTTIIFPVGNDYTVTAESCTEDAATTSNEGVGQVRYFGTSESFDIKTNEKAPVTVTCGMANAKVSISYDEVFTKVFTDYSVTVYAAAEAGRRIQFDSDGKYQTTNEFVFFNVDSSNPKLVCEVSGSYKGNTRTATQEIELKAAKWYKLNIKTSASGQINLSAISIDDTVTEESQEVEVNPYQ